MALLARYDATEIAGLKDSESVSKWSDLSGNGYHVEQGTASKKPTYKTAQSPTGLAVVRFDGGDSLATIKELEQAVPYTVIVVAKRTGGRYYIHFGLSYFDALEAVWRINAGKILTDGVTDESWHVFTLVFDEGTKSRIRIDGTQVKEGDSGGSSALNLVVGASATGASGVIGDIGEARLYSGVLTLGEIETLEKSLRSKWVKAAATLNGKAKGTFTFSGSVIGENPTKHGQLAGQFTFSGSVKGQTVTPGEKPGKAKGTFTFTGGVKGTRVPAPIEPGTATGAFIFSGSAKGHTVSPEKRSGVAKGTFAFIGEIIGRVPKPANANGTFSFSGAVSGRKILSQKGQAAGAFSFIGSVSGIKPELRPAPRGSQIVYTQRQE